jgi:TonB family protein
MSEPSKSGSQSSAPSAGAFRPQLDDFRFEADFIELAERFSALSGGGFSPEISADLALEVVLNEIVERACGATGATGAAIVLWRDGEMVCRASSGHTAPELGARLDSTTGLSGECVRSLRTQRCADVLSDPRADIEASYRLGVRSVVVMPLLQGQKLLGLLELLSSHPAAFSEKDELVMEALASRTLSNLDRASRPLPPPQPVQRDGGDSGKAGKASFPSLEKYAGDATSRRRFDWMTWVLGGGVVVSALLLGVVVTQHFLLRPRNAGNHLAASADSAAAANTQPAAGDLGGSRGKPADALQNSSLITASPNAPVDPAADAVPPGGLLVSQDGKEIFRMNPRPGADKNYGHGSAPDVKPSLPVAYADDGLLERVEPDYPQAARLAGIQGAVILVVQIRPDGRVESAEVQTGPTDLTAAAVAAVKQWRFRPHVVAGRATAMTTTVTLNFRLPPA